MSSRFPTAVPEIPVSDVTSAAAYYREKLGFSVDWVDARSELAGVSRDDCRLFLAGPAFRGESGNAAPIVTWLNLDGKDRVDDLHRACKRLGPSC